MLAAMVEVVRLFLFLFYVGLAYGFLSLIVRTFVRGVRKNIFVNVTTDTRYTKDVRMSID